MRNLLCMLVLGCSAASFAQSGEIKGFVYDSKNGDRLNTVSLSLDGTDRIMSSDKDGFYSFPKLEPGEYTLVARLLGYDTMFKKLIVKDGVVKADFYLVNQKMGAVVINAKRRTQITGPPVTTVTGKDIREMPSIGSEPDIMQYLQTLPGVVFSGDQGGQLYIRGGSPVMNKIMLDGLPIYNPFHSIGLFSVFDVDLIKEADVYTAGFGAEYGGRIGAVIDVHTRDGNKNAFGGKISASTFASKILLEGPLKKFSQGKSNSSFAISYRNSYLRNSSKLVYPFIPERKLPYNFGDLFAKFTTNNSSGGYFKLYGFRFGDNVKFPGSTEYNWQNTGLGGTFLLVPEYSKTQMDGFFMYSRYKINQIENDEKPRFSGIGGISFGLNFAYNLKRDKIRWGLDVNGFQTNFSFYNPNGRLAEQNESTTEINGYAKYNFKRRKFMAEFGLRGQYYASLGNSSLEPRVSFSYRPKARLNIYGAAGLYSQNLLSAVSDRDVVNLFYGFLSGPDDLPNTFDGQAVKHRLQKARHLTGGVEYLLGRNFVLRAEGFYKFFDQLTNINRDKLFDDNSQNQDKPERLRSDFIIERGNAYGTDFAITYNSKKLTVNLNYSLTYVNRYDGFVTYQPIFDRRHNGNAMLNYSMGKGKRPYKLGLRWSIGSGFPFTKTLGFYEKYDFSKGVDADYVNANGDIGILYSGINGGRLPYYHRLDFSLSKAFLLKNNKDLNVNFGITNVYDRDNIFYFDRVTFTRENQLPFLPSVGLSYEF
jgi:hypothetical protein